MAELMPQLNAFQVGELILQGEEPPAALLARASFHIDLAEDSQGTNDCHTYLAEAKRSLQVLAQVLRNVTMTPKDEK